MARYMVQIGLVSLRGKSHAWGFGVHGPIEARDAEDAAGQVIERLGGDRTRMQEADPIDGMPVYHCQGRAFAVERLTP